MQLDRCHPGVHNAHRVKPHATQLAFDPRDKSTSSRLSNPSYLTGIAWWKN